MLIGNTSKCLPQSEHGVDLHVHKPQETWGEERKYDFKKALFTGNHKRRKFWTEIWISNETGFICSGSVWLKKAGFTAHWGLHHHWVIDGELKKRQTLPEPDQSFHDVENCIDLNLLHAQNSLLYKYNKNSDLHCQRWWRTDTENFCHWNVTAEFFMQT